MNRATPLLAWGLVLIMAGALLYIWSGSPSQAAPLLVAGAAAAIAGGVLGRRPHTHRGPLSLPDRSPPAVLVAIGVAVAAVAVVGGWWLALLGGGLALVGLGGLVREWTAARRERSAVSR